MGETRQGQVDAARAYEAVLVVAAAHTGIAEWREGMAESLPFPDRSFDAVASQFALMFFRDRWSRPTSEAGCR